MNCISKSFVAAVVLLCASAVSAGTLYWQVDDSSGYNQAMLWAVDGSDNYTPLSGVLSTPTGLQQADLTSYANDSSYRFFVELINSTSGAADKDGYKWSYTELMDSGYVSFSGTDLPKVMAAAGAHGNFAAAPEPTSGLLLLMGGAMLALRRRRQK